MKKIKFKKLNKDAILPTYATVGSACFDFYAIDEKIIEQNKVNIISTGLSCEIPKGYCMKIYSRSGMGFNKGISLCNSVGIVDSDYRGEIKIGLVVVKDKYDFLYCISKGERIAQGMLMEVKQCQIEWTDKLSETTRGIGGFGSTGR